MGTVSTTHTVNAAWTLEVSTIPTENQLIYSVSALYLSNPAHNVSPYVSVGLMQGGTTLNHISALLASGHPHFGFPIGWTGRIPTEVDMYIFVAVYAGIGTPILLTAYLMPYTISPEGILQIDP